MNNPKATLVHQKLSGDIIRAAMAVHKELRPGFDEKLYERAMVIELQDMGYAVDQQIPYNVQYRDRNIGTLIPDMIVDGKVIVDPKVVEQFNDTHIAQMIGYLHVTQLKLAMLINFKHFKLTWKRIVI